MAGGPAGWMSREILLNGNMAIYLSIYVMGETFSGRFELFRGAGVVVEEGEMPLAITYLNMKYNKNFDWNGKFRFICFMESGYG